jgi:hypothetical protein
MITACLLFALFFAAVVFVATATELIEQRDEARTLAARLEAEANAHAAENARLTTELAARGPRLRVVPPQRDGSEYEWPRIARVLEIEEGGA